MDFKITNWICASFTIINKKKFELDSLSRVSRIDNATRHIKMIHKLIYHHLIQLYDINLQLNIYQLNHRRKQHLVLVFHHKHHKEELETSKYPHLRHLHQHPVFSLTPHFSNQHFEVFIFFGYDDVMWRYHNRDISLETWNHAVWLNFKF